MSMSGMRDDDDDDDVTLCIRSIFISTNMNVPEDLLSVSL